MLLLLLSVLDKRRESIKNEINTNCVRIIIRYDQTRREHRSCKRYYCVFSGQTSIHLPKHNIERTCGDQRHVFVVCFDWRFPRPPFWYRGVLHLSCVLPCVSKNGNEFVCE
jgi:hypothetical protein